MTPIDRTPQRTLCWTCANATTGGCSWSEYGTFKPVSGWTAQKTHVKAAPGTIVESYFVYDCPEYIQDSLDGGLTKLKKEA